MSAALGGSGITRSSRRRTRSVASKRKRPNRKTRWAGRSAIVHYRRKHSVRKISGSAKDFHRHIPYVLPRRVRAHRKSAGSPLTRSGGFDHAIREVQERNGSSNSNWLYVVCWRSGSQEAKKSPASSQPATPADGHTIHVTAPHVVAGKVMGPYHHYCKVLSPEPVIECLCYSSSDPGARLEQVEYIIAKSITRTGAVSLPDWNKNWHDHKREIATGRVQVHDMPQTKPRKWRRPGFDHRRNHFSRVVT